jgi:bifunctional non-homologous end joining protein LigD
MLATLVADVPSGPRWAFEPKWDGVRAIGRMDGGRATLTSRNRLDLTERFSDVAGALPAAVAGVDCLLDGEVCAFDEAGRPSFSALQRGARPRRYELFDILEVGGERLLGAPYEERRARLEDLVSENERVAVSPATSDGEALLAEARARGLEGIVAKRLGSHYEPGARGRDWLKIKARLQQEVVVCGYVEGRGRLAGRLGALILGLWRAGELVWVGNCGTGFNDRERDRLRQELDARRRPTPPFRVEPRMPRVRRGEARWVEPDLVCEVEFAEWTTEGHLRQPSYHGLREDKPAGEARPERPAELELRHGRRTLRLTRLDKVFWPREGVTKGDLVDYYREIAPVLLPHVRDRPLALRRFPDGIDGESFYQQDVPRGAPDWLRTAPVRSAPGGSGRGRILRHPVVDDDLSLLWLVQVGCIEVHPWLARADRPDRPEIVLIDLDPPEGAGFAAVTRAARLAGDALRALGLDSWPKTSGSKGMHLLVPVSRRQGFAETRAFVVALAETLARAEPEVVTTEWSRARRRGVLIDANQNGAGKTAASAYSVRPRAGAPVSTPLDWDEVDDGLDPRDLTMAVVLERVRRRGDLLAPALERRQALGPAARALRTLEPGAATPPGSRRPRSRGARP